MCTFAHQGAVIDQIDKYRKHCLWRGNDINHRINFKAAWPTVSKPNKIGGLGVIDLRTQNEALLIKNLHKFFNRVDVPWVHLIGKKYYSNGKLPNHVRRGSFWWRDVLKLLDKFKGLASVNIADGSSCLLWDDMWDGRVPRFALPELYSFAKKNKSVSPASHESA